MVNFSSIFLTFLTVATFTGPCRCYWAGVGISDITGTAAEIPFQGYADPSQTSQGIHMRLYARAFIFSNQPNTGERVVIVIADLGMISQLVKLDVIRELQRSYGVLYTAKNVALSCTHTHSGPGGYAQNLLFHISTGGYISENHDAIVKGIVDAITTAHRNMKPANIKYKSGTLSGTQINRSPTAYQMNPAAERAQYSSNYDSTMHLIRINDVIGNAMGSINWFPVHGTSMGRSNRLISGDNKGYASQMLERTVEPGGTVGYTDFVAAFAQSNSGDVSPNTGGAKCSLTGLPCDMHRSYCEGESNVCLSSGPGRNMKESTKIIGERQFQKALELLRSASTALQGEVQVIHRYVDMSAYRIKKSGKSTCPAAIGHSFAAGTTDGEGDSGFHQGMTTGNEAWNIVRDFLKTPTAVLNACHSPKPIWLPTGTMDNPYDWTPSILDTQIIKIGQLVILAVPGEFTTMAGRRLVSAVSNVFSKSGESVNVVIMTLSNVYTMYTATKEEYNVQRYEGAATLYGPNTLDAYIEIYEELAVDLIRKASSPLGQQPPYFKNQLLTFMTPVIYDGPGAGNFGDILERPATSYYRGATAKVVFVGANPRNSLGQNLKHFMTVESLSEIEPTSQRDAGAQIGDLFSRFFDSLLNIDTRPVPEQPPDEDLPRNSSVSLFWSVLLTDADWETEFHWERESLLLGTSRATLLWNIQTNQALGTYRICYHGHSKNILADITSFSNCSPSFTVL